MNEELKQRYAAALHRAIDNTLCTDQSSDEPVAWMVEDDEDISFIMNGKGLAKPDASWKSVTPVYTHPAKPLSNVVLASVTCSCGTVMEVTNLQEAKTLTDEEMYQLASECGFNVDGKAINDGIETAADFHEELFNFARAILRKAQEK